MSDRILRRSPGVALLGAALLLPLAAQSSDIGQGPTRQALDPEVASAPNDPSLEPGPVVAGGEVRFVPIEALSDAPRLPIGRVGLDGAEGDSLLAPASGNPFFLGFAAGAYAPAEDERVDPLLANAFDSRAAHPRPHGETYAFVMFERRISDERVAALEALGLRVLGYHPNNCLRVALPAEAVASVANLEFVRWIGVARPWQKVHPRLQEVLRRDDAEFVEVYLSVFESDLGPDSVRLPLGGAESFSPIDGIQVVSAQTLVQGHTFTSNGWQQRALESLGARIDSYSSRTDSFRGRIPRAALAEIAALDFVQFVEPWIDPTGQHDESMPLIHADLTRTSWSGGTTSGVVAGVVDSGMDLAHSGLNHVWAWGWDLDNAGVGAWNDLHGHGSHVSGTVFGKADPDRSLDGVAPGLGSTRSLRVYNVKVLNSLNNWGGAAISDVIDRLSNSVTDGQGFTTPRPHVINHSWGAPGVGWIGTETNCREFDAAVWSDNQMHVFAAGNSGSSGNNIAIPGAAKNVFTVGSVLDHEVSGVGLPSTSWTGSSRGPCGDLRWKPNVVAPGRWIMSVNASSGTGYVDFSGTSMAAPHVTGLAAQLMDHFDFLRYRPATLGAVMMATAFTKNGITLSAPSTAVSSHHNTYGAGRIEAFKAHNLAGQALSFWNFTMNSSSSHAELDLVVNTGATRVSFVMLYHEMAPSSGASAALINDLDMYLDREPFAPGGNAGDYWSHQSSRDNAETRILNNPQAGNWRIKIYPQNVPSTPGNVVRVGVAAVVTYGDLNPAATLATSVDKTYVKPNEVVQMTGTVANPSYVASAVHLATSLGSGGVLVGAETTLKDGFVANQMDNPADGQKITLGNIRSGQNRAARWQARWTTEGNKTWAVDMSSENAGNPSSSKLVVVDGTAPQGPTNITAPGHPAGFSRCNTQVLMQWTAATDNLSGVLGYRVQFDFSPTTNLPQTQNLGAVTSYSQALAPSPNAYYFHVRAVDRSGNWGPTQHYGPITIVPGGAYSYCTSAPNSAGPGATIASNGNVSLSANALQLVSSGLPLGQPSLYFAGTSAVSIPFGNGVRCAGGFVVRLGIVNTGPGTNVFNVNLGAGSPFGSLSPGQARYFQNWYRDPAAGGAGYNLTNGLHVLFCE